MRLEFQVKGNTATPYRVVFDREGDAVYATCSCAAGEMSQACKHRIALLDGGPSALISANADDVAVLRAMMAGTALQSSYGKLLAAQADVEAAKRRLNGAKYAFSRVMHRPK